MVGIAWIAAKPRAAARFIPLYMAGLYPSPRNSLSSFLSLSLILSVYPTSLPLYSRSLAPCYRDLISTQPIPRLEPRYDRQPNAARVFPWETELSSNEDIRRLRKEILSGWQKNVKPMSCVRMIKTKSDWLFDNCVHFQSIFISILWMRLIW